MPFLKFKRMFRKTPRLGHFPVPTQPKEFQKSIAGMEVTGRQIIEIRKHATKAT